MKKISEYIEENEVFEYFNQKLLEEVLLLRKLKFINLFREINESIDEYIILEGDGTFKGQLELANYINSILKNVDKDKTIIINNFNEVGKFTFFDDIIITFFEDDDRDGEYVASFLNDLTIDLIWDKERKRFKHILIQLNKNREDYFSKLVHELKHAHDDYEELKNNRKKLLYKKIIYSKYQLLKYELNDDNYTKEVKFINYLINDFEISAITSEIASYSKHHYYDIKDGLNEIKESKLYKDIINSYNNVNYILSNEEESDKYCKKYNEIFNTNKTNDHILNNLKKKFNKFYSKFINHLSNALFKKILEGPIDLIKRN